MRAVRHRRPAPRVTVIAEVGLLHDGSLGRACRLIDAAAAGGADVVKFQTHLAEAETLPDAPNPSYFNGEPRHAYFSRTAFSEAQWRRVKRYAESRGLGFLSSVFSQEAVEVLERVGVDAYKIPSGEVTNLPLLERVAGTRKPVLLSSGMSTWRELDAAVRTLRRRHRRITVLQCTSEYPCPPQRVGLNVLAQLRRRYGLPVGLSDHTLGWAAALAAVALGAVVVEKHLMLRRGMYGSDAGHSMMPAEFAGMVKGIRDLEAMLRTPVNKDALTPVLRRMRVVFQKSVVSTREIPRGAVLTPDLLALKKPGTGMSAARFREIVGRLAARPIRANRPLTAADVGLDR